MVRVVEPLVIVPISNAAKEGETDVPWFADRN